MYREAINKLIAWKGGATRKPLLVNGARQVGKTWLIQEFGTRSYGKMAYFRFDNNKTARAIFEQDYDIPRIISQLSLLSGVAITPGDTLIVFDEVQEAPKALTALKYFCEDTDAYHVIAAGSLLGVKMAGRQGTAASGTGFLSARSTIWI